MTVARSTILWDFDGTLAYRLELWRSALMEVLDDREPGHRIDIRSRPGGITDTGSPRGGAAHEAGGSRN